MQPTLDGHACPTKIEDLVTPHNIVKAHQINTAAPSIGDRAAMDCDVRDRCASGRNHSRASVLPRDSLERNVLGATLQYHQIGGGGDERACQSR